MCFSSLVKGQASLGVDSASYNGSTSYNSIEQYLVHVRNYGSQSYSGPLHIIYAIDSTTNNIGPLVIMADDSVNATIGVFGSLADSASVTITPTLYKTGINTVVIWPRSTSAAFLTHDSLKLQVLVMPAGIENHTQSKPVIFPNPMQGRVFVTNKDPNFIIEQVRICDISGQLVHAEKFIGSVDVSKLAAGVYTLEFTDKSGKSCRYKVVKE